MVLDKLSFALGCAFSTAVSVILYSNFVSSLQPIDIKYAAKTASTKQSSNSPNYENAVSSADEFAQLDMEATGEGEFSEQTHQFRDFASILAAGLSEYEIGLLGDMETVPHADALQNNPQLLNQVVDNILYLQDSPTRDYLINVLKQSSDSYMEQAGFYLVASERVLDQMSGVALIMNINQAELKVTALEQLAAQQIDSQATKYLLQHLRIADDIQHNPRIKQVVDVLFNNTNDSELKALALQASAPAGQIPDSMFNQIFVLVDSANPQASFQGLEALNGWLHNREVLFNSNQIADARERVNAIADDRSFSIETRMKALELLGYLQ
ncbi:hypothetical protein [Catenovulum agarivorans]|uniref:hypothetical protein n=1 Tax=Catenovulum agarivorans TaxID=1172192 RepID=UPI00030BBC15|nr:hypothetical protein [Catenovulum agarivorans]